MNDRHSDGGYARHTVELGDGRRFTVRVFSRPGPGRIPTRIRPSGLPAFVDVIEATG